MAPEAAAAMGRVVRGGVDGREVDGRGVDGRGVDGRALLGGTLAIGRVVAGGWIAATKSGEVAIGDVTTEASACAATGGTTGAAVVVVRWTSSTSGAITVMVRTRVSSGLIAAIRGPLLTRCATMATDAHPRDEAAMVPTSQVDAKRKRLRTATSVTKPPCLRANSSLNCSCMSREAAGVAYRTTVANVTLIEDDHRIRESLVRALSTRGHIVTDFSRGIPGLDSVVAMPPDVLVLDLGLPDIDGRDLLIELRKVSAVPIIVATARDDEQEVIRTLHAGADDYVVKPFSAEQLDARILALLRRTRTAEGTPIIEVGGLRIDPRHHAVLLDGQPIEFTRKEFDLLAYLAARPGVVVGKQELLAEVWRQPWGGSDKTVDVHLSWLRRKLGETAAEPRYLRAVRGVGVKLVAPDQ